MDFAHHGDVKACKERIARVVWVVHILSYLTNKQSHPGQPQLHASQKDGDEDEEEDENLDASSEKTVLLQGSAESIRSKFLDCIAQLLSSSKGWHKVTAAGLREYEDSVEIDVARNDCFGMAKESQSNQHGREFKKSEKDFCGKMTEFLATGAEDASSSEFELAAIVYSGKRVDYWVEQLKHLYASSQSLGSLKQSWHKSLSRVDAWTKLTSLLGKQRKSGVQSRQPREKIVQLAYQCVSSTEIRDLLLLAFGAKIGSKLWHALNFVARPIIDCRMLWNIAAHFPQFRNVRIIPVSPHPEASIAVEFLLDISRAWIQLNPTWSPGSSEMKTIAAFDWRFKADCAKSHALHAEMQLFMHYENSRSAPTSPYFGCSKKACLLCETFLSHLPTPIATRGRHGICYPAWGLPPIKSDGGEAALRSLEKMLVSRIQQLLNRSRGKEKNDTQDPTSLFQPHVPQSTLVSNFSTLTVEYLKRREENVKSSQQSEEWRRKERLILEGAVVPSQRASEAGPELDPEDSCVMCNKSPAKLCNRCRSTWYCSRDCQKIDWPSHRLLCKNFSVQAPRPSSNYRRAIFFPVERQKPQMIWIPCERIIDDEDGILFDTLGPHSYLGENPPVQTVHVMYNAVRGRRLGFGMSILAPVKRGFSIALKFRETFLVDGSAINTSIIASVGASGNTPHPWCGPMLAVRSTPFGFYEDITLRDFRHAIDYLVSYGSVDTRESPSHPEDRTPARPLGVKICCVGEEKLHGSEPFVSVEVSRAHVIYGMGSTSPVAKLLGMPLRLWKEQNRDAWIDPPGWNENLCADSNPNAAYLMIATDPKKSDWGLAPPVWNSDLGNVLAVRADGKDLDVEVVRLMCQFARWKLSPMIEDACECKDGWLEGQKVMDYVTWENVMKYEGELAEKSKKFQEK